MALSGLSWILSNYHLFVLFSLQFRAVGNKKIVSSLSIVFAVSSMMCVIIKLSISNWSSTDFTWHH